MNLTHPESTVACASADLSDRLAPLCDGRPGIRSALNVQASAPPEGETAQRPVIDFVASSQALDRYGEIIVPAGWRLENYRRNPVFQNAHQYGDVIFTLGKALETEVREVSGRTALFQRIEFAVEINPMARIAYGLYRGQFLNAVSVGFIPIRWENGSAEAGYRRKYLEQELLEVSAVGIPANPEALQLGLKAGAIERSDLQELLNLLQSLTRSGCSPTNRSAHSILTPSGICSEPAATNTHSGARGVHGDGAQLLQLARALRDLLRRT